ncbi:pyruvate dehydrogenase (acetyl-transferring), homodimeric type [bacterium]|nr:pyruvate dehydrogenase (acetyl-transferring), homodimeric type [bacterium]
MLKHLAADAEDFVDIDPDETQEWLDSLVDVIRRHGPQRVQQLLMLLQSKAYEEGVLLPFTANTPYMNTIAPDKQPRYPGNRELERRIKSIIRWNAMAMVVRAYRENPDLGGHISTYASSATLYEVGFNHFFRGPEHPSGGDFVYFQGHSAPGIYARAFLEGRLTEENLRAFRQDLKPAGGITSYPHPWLMPKFWQFPTVSMGLGPLMALYHARFNRYLTDRGLRDTSQQRIWCFVGDGETDEPETLGAINLASREKLDNLIFVINCNLQRLDGPVRGNGKIIQELEAGFRGSGWNVIKLIWGSDWDPLIAADSQGKLVQRMGEVVDGEYQKYSVEKGSYIREHFFGTDPDLRAMVDHLSDDQLRAMRRGGHDPEKVYAAFKAAVDHRGAPSVILAKTIKGYGLGEAGEGRNVTHQQKKLNEEELREFRSRFGIPIGDDEIEETPFYVPPADSPEIKYLKDRRKELGGSLPSRRVNPNKLEVPALDSLKDFMEGSGEAHASTTMAFVRLLSSLLRDKKLGKYIVPIVPDEARTFGMEGLFRQAGIYAHKGQLYEPVDKANVLYYKESKDGQLLEEGINEAGALCSFIAAGTAYANHGLSMIPFFIYYSMFGFQRVGDLIWAAADSRTKGFLLGGTAGRTTLNGEGLQHQDGHSPILAATVPNILVYDPAYAYEVAVIIQDGLRRMYVEDESIFYYLTLYNENYSMPHIPEGVAGGIVKGMYRLKSQNVDRPRTKSRPQLFGSGTILREALRAQEILAEKFGIATDVWSVTSYKELRRDAMACERWNRLNPEGERKTSYLDSQIKGIEGPFIAVSDYMRLVPDQISRWIPGGLVTLGTDGFGRSESRQMLRRHFEIDAEHTAFMTLGELHRRGEIDANTLIEARKTLAIDPTKIDPAVA